MFGGIFGNRFGYLGTGIKPENLLKIGVCGKEHSLVRAI